MIQVNRIYLIFNRLVTKKFLVDTSEILLFHLQAHITKCHAHIIYYSIIVSLLVHRDEHFVQV